MLKSRKIIFLGIALLVPLTALVHAATDEVWNLPDWQTLEDQAVGKWIELDARRGSRVYVALTGNQGRDGLPRIHYRHDRDADENSPTSSQVETMDVDCWRGETWRVALRVYDAGNQLSYEKKTEVAEPERILSFYQSPLAQFCSREYLIKSLPDGRARWIEWLRLLETVLDKHRDEVPERNIPIPD